ncbi:MAG: response regulator transcription factor [Desulfosudaceae bacterium]
MTMSRKTHILIIEDESNIAEGLKLNLSLKGYTAVVAQDGLVGLDLWQAGHFDLIVLDIMLPGIDGFSVLQRIRLTDEKIPVLILSAKNEAADRIKGLSWGVDDYLTKPFELEEFLLRVERLLTRADWNRSSVKTKTLETYRFGGNTIDFVAGVADCRQGRVNLTDQEVQLLKLFINHKGRPLSRKALLEIGWGYSGQTSTRTVDNFIVRLRKYFENNPRKPKFFKSLRSVGYVFTPDETDPEKP